MVEEFLLNFGFSLEQIKNILSSYSLKNYKEETLYNKVKLICDYFLLIGFKKEEIIKLGICGPCVFSYSIERINNINLAMLDLGYTINDLRNMPNREFCIYTHNIDSIKNRFKKMLELGFTKEAVIKISKKFYSIYSYSFETINSKIEDLKSIGFTYEEVLLLISGNPNILGLSKENIDSKINELISLGFAKTNLLKIIVRFPNIISLSSKIVKEKIDFITSLGYSLEEVLQMIYNFPNIIGYKSEKISQKINLFRRLDLDKIVIMDTKNIMQSADMTYAKYMFYKSKGIEITNESYARLFRGFYAIQDKYGISKSELLKMYPYDEELKLK